MKKAFLVIALFLVSSLSYSQIDFKKGTVAEVLAMAKAENKIVMVDVMTDWCKWCIELDNKVYAKKDVSDFANANQVNYKIDAEKGEGVDFAKKYKIQGFPSILFLDGDGNEIDRVYGYVPAKDFLEMMTDYNKGINTYSYLQAEVEKNPSNIEASLKLADKYSMYSENDKAKEQLNKIVTSDPGNAQGKTDDAKLRLILFEEKDAKAKALETFISENPASDQLKDAYVSLSETYYYELSDLPNSEKWFKETLAKFPNEESVKSSYGQFLNQKAIGFADKGTSDEDYKKGLGFIDQALPYVAGSVNEASSYYIQSKLLYNLKDYAKAMESIDKALKIFDRKLYRDHKTKVEQQLSQK
jgi:thioredoxin-related protein